jgi:hypothetical protein
LGWLNTQARVAQSGSFARTVPTTIQQSHDDRRRHARERGGAALFWPADHEADDCDVAVDDVPGPTGMLSWPQVK